MRVHFTRGSSIFDAKRTRQFRIGGFAIAIGRLFLVEHVYPPEEHHEVQVEIVNNIWSMRAQPSARSAFAVQLTRRHAPNYWHSLFTVWVS